MRKIIVFCHFITEPFAFCGKTIDKIKTYRKSLKENEIVTSDSSNDCSKPEINTFAWFNMVRELQTKVKIFRLYSTLF